MPKYETLINNPQSRKTALIPKSGNKGPSQTAHPRSLTRAFVSRTQNQWILQNILNIRGGSDEPVHSVWSGPTLIVDIFYCIMLSSDMRAFLPAFGINLGLHHWDLGHSLRKHAYPNTCILKISPPKTGSFQTKEYWYFSNFCSKHKLWVLVRTASPRRFERVPTIYVFEQKY